MRAPDRDAGLYAIVLAAGGSQRLGRPKQLLELAGEPLIRSCIRRAQAIGAENVIVVLGAHREPVRAAIGDLPVQVAINSRWEEGMSTSIRAAMKELPADARGILLMLVDQPFVPIEHLQAMVSAWHARPDAMVASAYDGTHGVPAIFPRERFADLRGLQGDAGAKGVLRARPDEVIGLACPQASIDIDTEADLEQLTAGAVPSAD
jgi:CTP:molybdopterin cytidylyltransferase MocA